LLLIDLEWQGTEGLKLAQLAHSLRHRKSMPTILVAATKLSRHGSALARDAGVDECVIKTKDMSGVAQTVTRLLKTS
jgi:DNA-binding response OmpR family regulator